MAPPKRFRSGRRISVPVEESVWQFLKDHPEYDKNEIFMTGFNIFQPANVSPSKARKDELSRELEKIIHDKDEKLYQINIEFDDKIRKTRKEVESMDVLIVRDKKEFMELWMSWREEKMSQWGRSPPPKFQGDPQLDPYFLTNGKHVSRDWIFENWKDMDEQAWPEEFPDWYNTIGVRSTSPSNGSLENRWDSEDEEE